MSEKRVPERVGLAEARDSAFTFAASAWHGEPEPVDETLYTPWAEPGWHSWSDMSPEREFCEFAAVLVHLSRPASVIETGTGQGFLTRRISRHIGQRATPHLLRRESRVATGPGITSLLPGLSSHDFSKREPESAHFSAALCILDSRFRLRFGELEGWWQSAKSGAMLLVHDTGNGHDPKLPHSRLARRIEELGIPGFFLGNPRGGFLGVKP